MYLKLSSAFFHGEFRLSARSYFCFAAQPGSIIRTGGAFRTKQLYLMYFKTTKPNGAS